jgi:hypothetical protein
MDDNGSKSLDFEEFKKGLHDYDVTLEDKVRNSQNVIFWCNISAYHHPVYTIRVFILAHLLQSSGRKSNFPAI